MSDVSNSEVGIPPVGEVPSAVIDPKAIARGRVEDFLSLTVEGILLRPYTDLRGGITRYDAQAARDTLTDTRNRRLANVMLGLEGAVRTLCQIDPPYEEAEAITAERTIVDGETGEVKKYELSVSRAGSDFGTFLHCTYDTPDIVDSQGIPADELEHVLLPQDSYLMKVLRFGNPHEPTFFASENDRISPEWSTEAKEWLENGGRANREINPDRAYYDAVGNYVPGGGLTDLIYHRDRIQYLPLYREDAPGIEKYVAITQGLLTKFLDAIDGEHEVHIGGW